MKKEVKKSKTPDPISGVPSVKNIIQPIKSEFDNRDILQVIIGASVLSVPVGFTEETWNLGESLPLGNILILIFLSLVFIAVFTYAHYHKGSSKPKRHHIEHFSKRVFLTYVFSFIVVAVLLQIIQVAPWQTDMMLAFKRTAVVTFPCSMSAAIADVIK